MDSLHRHKCPQCQQSTVWSGNPDRPFCSERCRLIDLGAWLDEGYCIPAESPLVNEEDASEEQIKIK